MAARTQKAEAPKAEAPKAVASNPGEISQPKPKKAEVNKLPNGTVVRTF